MYQSSAQPTAGGSLLHGYWNDGCRFGQNLAASETSTCAVGNAKDHMAYVCNYIKSFEKKYIFFIPSELCLHKRNHSCLDQQSKDRKKSQQFTLSEDCADAQAGLHPLCPLYDCVYVPVELVLLRWNVWLKISPPTLHMVTGFVISCSLSWTIQSIQNKIYFFLRIDSILDGVCLFAPTTPSNLFIDFLWHLILTIFFLSTSI